MLHDLTWEAGLGKQESQEPYPRCVVTVPVLFPRSHRAEGAHAHVPTQTGAPPAAPVSRAGFAAAAAAASEDEDLDDLMAGLAAADSDDSDDEAHAAAAGASLPGRPPPRRGGARPGNSRGQGRARRGAGGSGGGGGGQLEPQELEQLAGLTGAARQAVRRDLQVGWAPGPQDSPPADVVYAEFLCVTSGDGVRDILQGLLVLSVQSQVEPAAAR